MSRPLQYLLDTDMCIYLLNDDLHIKARVAQVGVACLPYRSPRSVSSTLGPITPHGWMPIWHGCGRSWRRQDLRFYWLTRQPPSGLDDSRPPYAGRVDRSGTSTCSLRALLRAMG